MASSATDQRTLSAVGDTRSTGELARAVATDTATLVRKEVELARHELMEAVAARAKGAVVGGVAAVAGLLTLVFVGLTVAAALDEVMPAWAALLVVAAGFGVVAAVAAAVAVSRMVTPPMTPEATRRTVKENVEWARTQLKR